MNRKLNNLLKLTVRHLRREIERSQIPSTPETKKHLSKLDDVFGDLQYELMKAWIASENTKLTEALDEKPVLNPPEEF